MGHGCHSVEEVLDEVVSVGGGFGWGHLGLKIGEGAFSGFRTFSTLYPEKSKLNSRGQ